MKRAFYKAAGVSTGLVLALSAPYALALSVSPARTEVSLLPGAATQAVFTVSNPHAEPYDIELSAKPWFVYPDNQSIHVEDWLKLPGKKQFRLKPGKSRDIKVTLQCPKGAIGELMGMVSFAYQGAQASMITSMISTPIYMRVIGTEKNTGDIVALGAGTKGGVFQVGAQVKATGNLRLRPTGTIQLLDSAGNKVAAYFIPEASPIFPGQTHDCVGQGPVTPPAAGRYTLQAALKSGTLDLSAIQHIVVKANGEVEMEKEAPKS